jgi:hypothetical protein
MGEYNNELELWEQGTIKNAFVMARLISHLHLEDSVKNLVCRYVMEQHCSCLEEVHLCVVAHLVLTSTLLDDEMPIHKMPSVLYTSLRQETSDQVESTIQGRREILAKVSVSTVGAVPAIRNIPCAEELAACTKQNPFFREIIVTQGARQSLGSFEEQLACFQDCKGAIDRYCEATSTFTKCRAISGGPGCGKTFMMIVSVVYGMSRGLCITITCLLAKRADLLGGIHVHNLFAIPVHESASVQRLVELVAISLYKSPERLAFLQRLDLLFLMNWARPRLN